MLPEPIRTVFFGTPNFAVPALERLAADGRFVVNLVVTPPDRPAGRGRRLTAPPVKHAAERLGLPIYQLESLRSEEARRPLLAVEADIFVVAAFGLIFGRRTLTMPRLGCLNVHASLLPRFRGASPVAAAILCGDAETGVTLMKMDVSLDTGPIIASVQVPVARDATTESLTQELAIAGASLAVDVIPQYVAGAAITVPQSDVGASIVRPLHKDDGWMDWRLPAGELERRVRAMWPWPRTWTTRNEESLQIHSAGVVESTRDSTPGTVDVAGSDVVVACGRDALALRIVQPAGARPMPASALLAGRQVRQGDRLGVQGEPSSVPPLVEWLG